MANANNSDVCGKIEADSQRKMAVNDGNDGGKERDVETDAISYVFVRACMRLHVCIILSSF